MASELSPNPYKSLPCDDQKRYGSVVSFDMCWKEMRVFLSVNVCSCRFVCVYPAYLNARKTIVDGRRIPKSKAVDNPTSVEIRDVCTSQGLNCYLEGSKCYPREQIKDQLHGGRVRVQLRAADGSPVLENITTSECIMTD